MALIRAPALLEVALLGEVAHLLEAGDAGSLRTSHSKALGMATSSDSLQLAPTPGTLLHCSSRSALTDAVGKLLVDASGSRSHHDVGVADLRTPHHRAAAIGNLDGSFKAAVVSCNAVTGVTVVDACDKLVSLAPNGEGPGDRATDWLTSGSSCWSCFEDVGAAECIAEFSQSGVADWACLQGAKVDCSEICAGGGLRYLDKTDVHHHYRDHVRDGH